MDEERFKLIYKKIVDSYQLNSKIAKRIYHKIMITLFGKDSDSDDWQENDTDKKREREKMKCYACKTDIRDEDSFCKKCGSPQRFTKLINQALQKDQEALAWLYKMTYNNVYHTICAVAKLDDDIVFDLIQDIYIKAFQNLSQLKEPEAFRGWIKVISRNETINYLRKKKEVTFYSLKIRC